MRTLILALVLLVMGITTAFSLDDIPDNMDQIRAEQQAMKACTDGYKLIAVMEDGDVKVYRVTSCIYYEGTDILARRDTCYVTVGELHGKTVATECIS
jgi:hypothetical protein